MVVVPGSVLYPALYWYLLYPGYTTIFPVQPWPGVTVRVWCQREEILACQWVIGLLPRGEAYMSLVLATCDPRADIIGVHMSGVIP